MLEIMWPVAFLASGVFLCRVVSYEFSKGLTADFSFSLLHVGIKVGGYHDVSLMNAARGPPNAARVPQSLDNPGLIDVARLDFFSLRVIGSNSSSDVKC